MCAYILPYQGTLPGIAPSCFIAPNATLIGDVHVGEDSNIWFGCVLRGDVHEIRVGKRTNIQDLTMVHVTRGKFGTYIGDDITIGHSAIIHAATLEDGCFVGMGATVMDGTVIESNAMLGAGALLAPGKRIRSGELWTGVPAKKIRDLREEERAWFPVSARNYVALGKDYLEALSKNPEP